MPEWLRIYWRAMWYLVRLSLSLSVLGPSDSQKSTESYACIRKHFTCRPSIHSSFLTVLNKRLIKFHGILTFVLVILFMTAPSHDTTLYKYSLIPVHQHCWGSPNYPWWELPELSIFIANQASSYSVQLPDFVTDRYTSGQHHFILPTAQKYPHVPE